MKFLSLLIITMLTLKADDYSDFISSLEAGDIIYKQHFNKSVQEEMKVLDKNSDTKPIPTLLIFTSKSIPDITIENYLADSSSAKLHTLLVYRGLDNGVKNTIEKISKNNKVLAKVHPLMFEDLNITRVPTLVYSECPKEFRYKECNHMFKMSGDANLEYFFEQITQHNNKDK